MAVLFIQLQVANSRVNIKAHEAGLRVHLIPGYGKSTVKVMNHATVTFLPVAAFYIQSLANSRVNNRVHGGQGREQSLIFIAGYRRS